MSKEKQKQKKKLAREKANKEQVLRRRAALRKEAQEENHKLKAQKQMKKNAKVRRQLEEWANAVADKIPPETLAQIEHNIEILKALEEEYEAEMAAKRDVQKNLEADGAETLDEKLKKLKLQMPNAQELEEALAEYDPTGETEFEVESEADVEFVPETAEEEPNSDISE